MGYQLPWLVSYISLEHPALKLKKHTSATEHVSAERCHSESKLPKELLLYGGRGLQVQLGANQATCMSAVSVVCSRISAVSGSKSVR